MLLSQSKGKKKPEKGRWMKIKEQTKGENSRIQGGSMKEYFWIKAFFSLFFNSKHKIQLLETDF